ncbi:MAG: hypothetical protein LBN31_07985 [Hungatella sp.]|jgi:CarD family transcriptional regulator|nr:hypothetical protein [Hungatella sp.]
MYETGDYVICRNGGVWRVEEHNGGQIHLMEHGSKAVKTISKDCDEIVRRIITKEELEEVIDRIGFIRTIQAPNDKIRNEFFREAMAKYEEVEWVKVIKTVYLRQQEKRISPVEMAYEEKARNFFYNEISVLLEIPFDAVEDYIVSSVSKETW